MCGQYVCGWTSDTVYHGNAELYDVSSNTWSYAAGMALARTAHAAVPLPTGHVLVAGGENQSGQVPDVEEYDPAANSWASVGSLATARSRLTAAVVNGDRAVLLGGWNGGASVSGADIYTPATANCSSAASMTYARSNHAAVALQDGRLLVTGGYLGTDAQATAEVLGPPVVASIQVSPANPDVVVGGTVPFEARATYSDWSMRTLSSSMLEWTPGPWMPTGRATLMATTIGDLLYVAGGYDGGADASAALEVYDPATRTWARRSPISQASVPAGRWGAAVGAIDGKLYMAGGTHDDASGPTSTLLVYDPATDAWTAGPPMPAASACSAGAVIGRKLYVLTGCDAGGATQAFHAYDADSNTWTSLAPAPRAHSYAAAAVLNGKFYAVGGTDGSDASGAVDVYDPASATWTAAAPMPTARWSLTAAVLGGKLHAVGGFDGNAALATVETYDPATGIWSAGTPLPTPRLGPAGAVANGTLFVVGGRNAGDPLFSVDSGRPEVAWTSSQPGIAPVSADGLASGASVGTAVITATAQRATGTTTVTVHAAAPPQVSVQVAKVGMGTVTSGPAGISCGAACEASFDANSSVTLTATPLIGSRFATWGGACTGSDPVCTLALGGSNASVTATFITAGPYTLDVLLSGSGGGLVTSVIAGISCPGECSASFSGDSQISLRAVPAAGSVFAGWSGACDGTATCIVSMTDAQTVTATFVQVPPFAALNFEVLHAFARRRSSPAVCEPRR